MRKKALEAPFMAVADARLGRRSGNGTDGTNRANAGSHGLAETEQQGSGTAARGLPAPPVEKGKAGEMVDHPKHYNMGKIEVIDAIEEWGLGFNDGNAVKYIARAEHKGNTMQDLKKALWFLQRHIARKEKDLNARAQRREGAKTD